MDNFKTVSYANMGEKTTVCVIACDNGFEATGSFCCKACDVDNTEFREQKAYECAIRSIERYKTKRAENKR